MPGRPDYLPPNTQDLSDPEYVVKGLQKWLPPEEPILNPLEMAGYARNIERAAGQWGPHLIAMMADAGLLGPEENPGEVLEDLIASFQRINK